MRTITAARLIEAGRLAGAGDLSDQEVVGYAIDSRAVLDAWGRVVIAIGGSAGKTTTKDLTAHVLAKAGRRVLKSHKNYNNELGLPLSILQMESGGRRPADFDVAVLEMGVSMPGEIKKLCSVAPPDVAVELCVAPEHLEFLGTIERVAEAEGEIIENIKPGGTAILNADDELVIAMHERHRHGPTITFGIENVADVSAKKIEAVRLGLTRFVLRTPLGEATATLPLPGRHNLMNALAAAAVATTLDIAPDEIAAALADAAPSEMRGEVLEFADGFVVIDDTYNSNPRSLVSSARMLSEGYSGAEESARRVIVVAGEMLELGPESAAMHREAGGEMARGANLDLLWGVRGDAAHTVAGATEEGKMSEGATRFFTTSEEAANALAAEVRSGDLVLVKGSRGVRMDLVIKKLRQQFSLKRSSE